FYIGCTIVIAFLVWHLQGRPKSFTRWLLPKDVYGHRSNLLDFKLFLTNNLAGFLGIFGAVLFAPAVAYWVLEALTGGATSDAAPSFARSLAATVIIVMATDFCKYWAHRFHHEWKLLWPFHAVHHSADVLTPITVTRSHPVETLLRNLLITGIVGIVQAVVLWGLVGHVDLVTIGGANALTFAFNALGSNLRHSHIWLSYGPVLEHVFISPAQHQVHHSVAVEHHDKNYGSIFAIWDWMFGTLYVPRGRESLTFGVSDADGNKAEQPYPTLQAALLKPFRQSWEAARVRLERQGAPMGREMTPGFSLWLDVLRVLAAMTVLFGHMAHIRFTGGDYYVLREWNVASDAVIVFFVLSGVVIAFAAERDGTLERFSFNRLTRLWSVLVPALILTWVFDSIGTRVDMNAYPEGYYTERTAWEMFGRGLTFSNEWQGVFDRVRLGTNGPLWSLSYEAGFYALFGAALFLRGALRWVMLALIALVVGLPILALLPAWLLGVAVWHLGCHMPRLAAP
ncbi:MAG: sterol desaturase family protein, partial [Pseudomonadota bacterium]